MFEENTLDGSDLLELVEDDFEYCGVPAEEQLAFKDLVAKLR